MLKIDWQTRKTNILVLRAEFIKGAHQQLELALSVLFAYELVAELSIRSVKIQQRYLSVKVQCTLHILELNVLNFKSENKVLVSKIH